jgi:NAD(P)H-flavin reductase
VGVKGPRGAFTYTPGMVKELGMIAGGTGITPMLQVSLQRAGCASDPFFFFFFFFFWFRREPFLTVTALLH